MSKEKYKEYLKQCFDAINDIRDSYARIDAAVAVMDEAIKQTGVFLEEIAPKSKADTPPTITPFQRYENMIQAMDLIVENYRIKHKENPAVIAVRPEDMRFLVDNNAPNRKIQTEASVHDGTLTRRYRGIMLVTTELTNPLLDN